MFHRNYITNLQSSTLRKNANSSLCHTMNQQMEINRNDLWSPQCNHQSTLEPLCQLKAPKDLAPNASLHDKEWKRTKVTFSASELKKKNKNNSLYCLKLQSSSSQPSSTSPQKEGKGENDVFLAINYHRTGISWQNIFQYKLILNYCTFRSRLLCIMPKSKYKHQGEKKPTKLKRLLKFKLNI